MRSEVSGNFLIMDKVFQVDELTIKIKEKFAFLKELQAIHLSEDDPSGLKSIIVQKMAVIKHLKAMTFQKVLLENNVNLENLDSPENYPISEILRKLKILSFKRALLEHDIFEDFKNGFEDEDMSEILFCERFPIEKDVIKSQDNLKNSTEPNMRKVKI